MGKFSSSGGREMPELNTQSLPDLIFAFLFFIMMVTTIREVTAKVEYNRLPVATELTKLEEKSLVTFIYIGKPTEAYRSKYGSNPCIQLNGEITQNAKDVYTYAKEEMAKIDDARRKLMTTSLKVDKDTKMKIISDVKEELRRADALNISYSSRKAQENN
ncbi:biopolymer transporter ExbD [Porphyromonas macacae]|uniref:Biopolymer transporter ExbD n=1 Tax=Porphyromonas macacae TaxID=28115 RepID=A0A0A2EJD1_9PORP|nr:biopolymer transporter ExbD [Porphyromonas macacae]KGN76479.1 biopolymer transporter ExbD [Porphyromonas macacae]